MPTLTELAEQQEALARRLREQGRHEDAAEPFEMAADLRRALTEDNQSGKLPRMVTAERVRHSKGSTGDDPFRAAVNASHFTIRSLAEKLGVSHAHLSQARRGQSSIARALAEEIQRLTGFAATKHNWPKLKS